MTLHVEQVVRCRFGSQGTITGIQGPRNAPELVWVTHPVASKTNTHLHRQAQMAALLAQGETHG